MKFFAVIICLIGLIDQYLIAENNMGQSHNVTRLGPQSSMALSSKSGNVEGYPCEPDEWKCRITGMCISLDSRCDDYYDDCGEDEDGGTGWDVSDEENCECVGDENKPSDDCPSENPICAYNTCRGINSMVYAKLEGKYCSKWDGEFRSVQEAQNNCTMDVDCEGIYADGSRSSVHLCRNNHLADNYLPSSNGSVVFEKDASKIDPCTPDFCMNGGTCVVRADAPNNAACDCQSTFTGERCTETCQSCHGAESSTRRCCQTCNEVGQAFKEKGLNFNLTGVWQCDDSGIKENNDDQYEVMFRKCCFEAFDEDFEGAGNLTSAENQCSKDPKCTGVMKYKGQYYDEDLNDFFFCSEAPDEQNYWETDCSNGIYFVKKQKSKFVNSRTKEESKLGHQTEDKNMILGSGYSTSGGKAFDGHRSFGHQRTAAYSSDSISCDGDIDTPYDCYQCFDVVAGKYFWGSSCKAKKLASTDMVNGKCGLDYTCVTKDIGTCPYNDYCPDNAKSSGQHLNNGYSWSPNVESVFKYTSADLGNALRKPSMPYSTILGHPLKLEGEVKVQAFNDQTLRVKLDHIHFYSNGTEVSLTNAHQILDTERSNGGLMSHTAQIFENSLIAPFMVLTKGGVLKKMIVSQNEPAEVTGIKKMLASDLEMKTNQAQLRLVMKKAVNTPLATPRFPTKIDLELRSVNDEEALGVRYGTGAGNDAHKTEYHKSAFRSGNLVSGNHYSPSSDVGCLDRKHKCQPGTKCVWQLRDGALFGECKPANKMKEGPILGAGNVALDIEAHGLGSGSGNFGSGKLYSPGVDVGCLDSKHKCQPGMKCVWKLRDGKLFGECKPANKMKEGPMLGTENGVQDIKTSGSGSGSGSPSEYLSTTIMAQAGTERRFSIYVHSGQSNLTVAISGGTGDADLYVKYGEVPSLASYDCRPYKWGNNERCSFRHQYAGTWYIMVYAYSNYSGVKLTAGESNGAVKLNQIQTEMAAPDNQKGEELDRLFDKATRYIRNLPPNHLGLSLETQLFFYSRYKQVKVGPCNIPKPYFRDTMATQKWKAWKNLGNMSKEQAKSEYIQKLDTVAPRWRNKDR